MTKRERPKGATVLSFPPEAARPRRPAAAPQERGAILLFTGVRYERMPEAPPLPLVAAETSLAG